MEALDSQEGVNVDRIYIVPHSTRETAIVRYEFIEDLILRERDNLDYIKKIVDNVREDKVLPALKNKDQRELYFLDRYGIESFTAGKVWEYMKMKEKEREVQ